jgi:predicted secreted protein
MNRSKKCVFLCHCLLAQGVMAKGLVKLSPAIVKQVLVFCMENDINVFQMPCPELLCLAGGFGRNAHGKKWYEDRGLRETSSQIAKQQADYMLRLIRAGFEVFGIIGLEFSPACAPNYLNRGCRIVKGRGIYMEELEQELGRRGINVRFIGVNQRWARKLAVELDECVRQGNWRVSAAQAADAVKSPEYLVAPFVTSLSQQGE